MPSYARVVRNLVPPLVWDFGKRRLPWLVRGLGGHFTHIRFEGDYATYAEARRASTGYDAPAILKKTREALLMVKNGEHRWERDAMISDTDEMPWTLLACLTRVAAAQGRKELRVLDFGGSLGSTYFWCRPFFAGDFKLSWQVVEQPEHVKVGRADFESDELHFFYTVEEALQAQKPDVLLISGVLHFLEEPEAWLETLRTWGIPYLLLDRTPLWNRDRHRLAIQYVPREIYEATYPAWFLSQSRVVSLIERDYRLLVRAPDTEVWEIDGEPVQNALWFFQRR